MSHELEALAAGMNEEIKTQNIVLEAYVRRIAELEAAIAALVRWRAQPWVPRGVNLPGLGSVEDSDIEKARAETADVWANAEAMLPISTSE